MASALAPLLLAPFLPMAGMCPWREEAPESWGVGREEEEEDTPGHRVLDVFQVCGVGIVTVPIPQKRN